jgi:hypothetical protein
VGQVHRPDEHCRASNDSTVDEFHPAQPVGLDHQPRDLTAHDLDPASLQLLELACARLRRVNEEGR